jgi:hypothetical protein
LKLVPIKALAGFNYVRADRVIAIGATDPARSTIYMEGGVAIPANEPAKDVIAKLQAAEAEPQTTETK